MIEITAKKNIIEDTKDMRAYYCDAMCDLTEENPDVVVLDADLMGAMGLKNYIQRYPDNTINCGIQEANMYGVAAGLSVTGKIPFAHTFSVFTSRRALDQIYLSCVYAGLNVKIIGSDPGIYATLNGGTHMSFDDLGIFRAIPEMTVIEATDGNMITNLIPKIGKLNGCVYFRTARRSTPMIYENDTDFTIGEANILKQSKNDKAAIIAIGYGVSQAMLAAEQLADEGINVSVIDCFTLKPIDRQAVLNAAKSTNNIITVENHNTKNGLGSSVAEILCDEYPCKLTRLGADESFGVVGQRDYLAKYFKIDKDSVIDAVKKSLEVD